MVIYLHLLLVCLFHRMPPKRRSRRSTPYNKAGNRGEGHGNQDDTNVEASSSKNNFAQQLDDLRQTVSAMQESITIMATSLSGLASTAIPPAVTNEVFQNEQAADNTQVSSVNHHNEQQEITIRQAVDDHVHAILNPPDALTNKGTYSAPDRPIDLKVSDKLRQKIYNDQYVDLASLLDNVPESNTLSIISEVGEPLRLAPHKSTRTINTLGQWCDAFMVYLAVYTHKYPHQISALASYMQLVKRLASRGGDFVHYDKEFRLLRQRGLKSWEIHMDLWLECRDVRSNVGRSSGNGNKKGNGNSFRGFPSHANKAKSAPVGYCFRYHQTGRCHNAPSCPFKHNCYKPGCSASHPAFTCSGGRTQNNVPNKDKATPATK